MDALTKKKSFKVVYFCSASGRDEMGAGDCADFSLGEKHDFLSSQFTPTSLFVYSIYLQIVLSTINDNFLYPSSAFDSFSSTRLSVC